MQLDGKSYSYLYGEAGEILSQEERGEGEDGETIFTVQFRHPARVLQLHIRRDDAVSPDRVEKWAFLIEHYNQLGIYGPCILRTCDGPYAAVLDGRTVYATEPVKYPTVEAFTADWQIPIQDDEQFMIGLYESIGLAASCSAPLAPWGTVYSLYESRSGETAGDDNMACARHFMRFVRETLPEYASRVEAIFGRYCERRALFEATYRSLPRAVFQGDIRESNVLVSPRGRFRGMRDFSLSGSDTVLNYAFSECFCVPRGARELAMLDDPDEESRRYAVTRRRMQRVGKHYTFSDAEREAFVEYYNIFAPFCAQVYRQLMPSLNRKEHVKEIIGWVERQTLRRDVIGMIPRKFRKEEPQ